MTRRTVALLGVFAAVLLVAGGCARTVDGAGVALGLDPRTPSHTPRSTSTSPALPSLPGLPPAGTGRDWTVAQLVGRLLPPPAGSSPWDGTWAATTTPTVAQFVARFYPASARASEAAELHDQGITGIAHRTWFAADGHGVDILLLGFDDDLGARSRYLAVTSGRALNSTLTPFAVPGGAGYSAKTLDQDGYIRSFVYGTAGNVVIEEFYFSPGHALTADAVTWLRAQLARLG